jgi:hypothetical protein
MGNWNITVQGTGCHHNPSLAYDANKMAAEFVQKLRDAGHTITSATFTHGGADDVSDGQKYVDKWDAAQAPKPDAHAAPSAADA